MRDPLLPPKPRVKLESRFPAAKKAGWEAAQAARTVALNVGEHEAEKRLERIDDTRGYELPIDIGQENIGHQSGRIFYDPWYGRFFEYGTVRIPASPFMRPAHRMMRKAYVAALGADLKLFLRKARVR